MPGQYQSDEDKFVGLPPHKDHTNPTDPEFVFCVVENGEFKIFSPSGEELKFARSIEYHKGSHGLYSECTINILVNTVGSVAEMEQFIKDNKK